MHYEITPKQELYYRISKFQRQLQINDITGVIITQNTDLFYFSGTIQHSLLFIPCEGEPVLAVNGNIERASEESRLKNVINLKAATHWMIHLISSATLSRGRLVWRWTFYQYLII